MKACWLFFGLLWTIALSSADQMSVQEYIWKQRLNKDRQYAPITREMCRKSREFRKLKSCVLARQNPKLMRQLSTRYISSAINHWEARSLRRPWRDTPALRLVRSFSNLFGKRKRRDITENDELEKSKVLSRSKRDIPGNPCLSGGPKRTTIVSALDAETDRVVEVYQDPNDKYYQTFFTNTCARSSFFGMKCVVQYVVYMTAVFEEDESYSISVRPVKIPSNCAVSVSRYL